MPRAPSIPPPMKRFALSLPPRTDPRFDSVYGVLIDTVMRTAIRLRAQYAVANGVSFFDTAVDIVPDPDRPNVITVTACHAHEH